MLLLLMACGPDPSPKDAGNAAEGVDWQCDTVGTYGPRQLRLLTRREYQNTVRDLFRLGTGASCTSDLDCNLATESCSSNQCVLDPCNIHTFLLNDGGYQNVHVAGSFNGWPGTVSAGGWPLSYDPVSNRWWLKAELEPSSYQYKFVLNESTWIADPGNPNSASDGFGGTNSVLDLSCDGGGIEQIPSLDLTAAFPVESRPQGFPFENNAAAGLVSTTLADAQLDAAEQVAELATSDLVELTGCGDGSCTDAWIRDFGRRAWRRPLNDQQVNTLLSLIQGESPLSEGYSLALQVLLSSPRFLYRSEVGVEQGDGTAKLDAYELATAMSYFYWGSTPDDVLLDAAESGELEEEAGIRAQAERLLDDPRARESLAVFATQWLGAEPVLTTERYQDLPAETRAAMLQEVGDFVNHVSFDSTGRFPELLTAEYTVADPELASFYGYNAPDTEGKVATNGQRSGVLGLGAVMVASAHSDQTSPIRRGLFVRERLLCQDLGTPPANAGSVPVVDPDATTRERFSQHSADPFCASCHQYIDNVGFGFENLDPIGQWREEESGLPVDAAGNMNDIEILGSKKDHPYLGLPELGGLLAESDRAPACFSSELMLYAMGWKPEDPLCAFDPLREQFLADDQNIRSLLIAVPLSQTFRIRE